MTTLTEADVEQAALAWLEGLGWRVDHRPAMSPNCKSQTAGNIDDEPER